MLYVLVILSILIAVVIMVIRETNDDFSIFMTCLVGIMISGALVLIPISTSYHSYLSIKADYYGILSQYKDAVTLYKDKSVINTNKISFTDFGYQGFQQEMAKFIMVLCNKVTNYNALYIKKKTMHENIIFSWLIIPPSPGMKIVQISNMSNK